jgi:hypothetical protein
VILGSIMGSNRRAVIHAMPSSQCQPPFVTTQFACYTAHPIVASIAISIAPRGPVRHVPWPVNNHCRSRNEQRSQAMSAVQPSAVVYCSLTRTHRTRRREQWHDRVPGGLQRGSLTSCRSLARCQTSYGPEEVVTAPVACVPVRPLGSRRVQCGSGFRHVYSKGMYVR